MKNILIVVSLLVSSLTINASDVKENYIKYCVACHAKDGKSQTTMGKKVNAPDLTTNVFKADDAFKNLKDGVKKDGKETKKPFSAKLTDAEIKELVKYAETFTK